MNIEKIEGIKTKILLCGILIPLSSYLLPPIVLNFIFFTIGMIFVARRSLNLYLTYLLFGISSLISIYSSRRIYATAGDDFAGYYNNYELCNSSLSLCMQDKAQEYVLYLVYWIIPSGLSPLHLLFINCTIIGMLIYIIFTSVIYKNNNRDNITNLFLLFNCFIVSGSFFWGTQLTRAAIASLLFCYFIVNKRLLLFGLALLTHLTTIFSVYIFLAVKYRKIFSLTIFFMFVIHFNPGVVLNIINLLSYAIPDLGSKGIYIQENIFSSNLDLKKDILSSLPIYIFGFWYSGSVYYVHAWVLMILAEYLLWDFPILTLRLYFIIIFSGPLLLASIIDWKNTRIQPRGGSLISLISIQIYVMLIFSYRVYYQYMMGINSDFKIFFSYDPFDSIAYILWM